MTSSKWHAHGNVYRLVEPGDARLTPSRARELATGTDGVVEVVSADGGEAAVVIWNPDGSQAEMSGNATRIAARWLAERSGREEVTVRIGERAVSARMLADGRVEQELGVVTVGAPEELEGLRVVPVDVGNPHAVVEGDPNTLLDVGPLLETHPRFPERTNVQVARIDGPGRVSARVWERGVGETSASGTSAVAVAAATHGEGEVVVSFPGGDLTVRLENGRATLIGPAERLAD